MTHGSHWECVVKDVEEFLGNEFVSIIQNSMIAHESNEYGYNLETQIEQDNVVHTLIYPEDDAPVKIITYLCNKVLWTSYPVLNHGMQHEIIIEEIIDEGNMVEAIIKAKLKEYPKFSFYFMDTMYFQNKHKYTIGNSYTFIFNAFAYSLSENNMVGMNISGDDNNPILLSKESVILVPNEKGAVDDYKILSPIFDIEKYDNVLGNTGYIAKINLIHKDEYPFELHCYISQKNLKNDYTPKEGDSINGSLWICGMLDTQNMD